MQVSACLSTDAFRAPEQSAGAGQESEGAGPPLSEYINTDIVADVSQTASGPIDFLIAAVRARLRDPMRAG
jgi:hypothetical protein